MNKRLVCILALAMVLSACSVSLMSAGAGSYMVVPVKGDIDDGTLVFIRRALEEAEKGGFEAVIFEIDTYGGLVDASNKIRDEILGSEVRTIAFVNRKAWSAGALLAISCTELHMQSAASIGAAETRPAEEKYISAYRQQFESTAEERGRDPEIAAAMVDSDISIEGITEEGKILTLGAAEALSVGFADGVHESIEGLAAAAGLDALTRVDLSMNNSERLGQFLTSPVISETLLVVGVLGLIVEAFVPGFGIFGGLGVVGFTLFFYGRLVTGMAGWEIVILFVAGLALLITELFIPGFGVLGVSGLIAIFASFALSYPTPQQALLSVSIALAAAIIAVILLVRLLERKGSKASGLFGRLILTEVTGRHLPAGERQAAAGSPVKAGDRGLVYSTLRPVGTAYFGSTRSDVISEGEFLPPGTEVVVERIDGSKVVVRRAPGGTGETKGGV